MRWILVIVACCLWISSVAQTGYQTNVHWEGAASHQFKNISYANQVKDSLSVYKEAEKVIAQLQFKGYLLAEISSINFAQKSAVINIIPNQQFRWVNLLPGNLPSAVRQEVGFRERDYRAAAFNIQNLNLLFEKLLGYYENSGYPFASLSLQQVVLDSNNVSASIEVKPNQKILFDTIQVVGSAQLAQKYVQSYLNIKNGFAYNEKAVKQVENRLRELPFLQILKPSEVDFSNEKATLRIFADKKDASQFDGILGLQQNQVTGKNQLVGNLKLNLQNAFKRGEQLNFNYQGLAQQSQLLDIKVIVPHIFSTDFGIMPSLYLYKQDTSFLNVDTKLGFNYLLKGNNSFQFFVENRSTRLSSVEAYQNATALPSILDANTTFYGLGLNLENLDYRFNPQKGYSINADIAVGSKRIRQNAGIPPALYQNVPMSSTTYRWFSQLNFYLPLAKQLVAALSNQTGILSGKYLLANEVFRLGGQRSLRGFNELSLLANAYTYANAELRYLLEQNSFLFLFYNQAYLHYETPQLKSNDYPLGFGAGVNFETNLGILSISYALGKQKNIPLNLRQGKIHFGITALF
ncbi:BamA/TamA family outer membrane protein [Nubsella zeaxanthinifaciens]|uniref:BamA/TamA family outer membrane protein n=1 Tax=Nubsella zeaxanthinifaciens TaxID=392412 RepID=UPI000DE27DB6|nr:BamA/TamA family outer membrane protein [Nubsella zeaxanthinifaciens]